MYIYARERNIYPINAVLMTSGKQINHDYLRKYDVTDQQKIDLYVKIYSWNIEHSLQSLRQIKEEGVSCLPGAHPCNQVAAGLYVTAKGNVVGCPGFTEIEGNVRERSIKEIWENSQNRRRAGTFNCRCPPKDGITIPHGFYEEVLRRVEETYLKDIIADHFIRSMNLLLKGGGGPGCLG
jgi:MoaA/NifB/PqqE/SkfB family radical SAM enzyme